MDGAYDTKGTGQAIYNPDSSCNPKNCPLLRRTFPSLSDILEQEKLKKEVLVKLRDTIIALEQWRRESLESRIFY